MKSTLDNPKLAKPELPPNSTVTQPGILPVDQNAIKLINHIAQSYGALNLLDMLPCGISIATAPSCKTIIHNAMAARFLRIDKWDNFSHSASTPPPAEVFSQGRKISAAEMPVQRAAWNGETVAGAEYELVWPDGVRKFSLWSARPLYENGIINGDMATCEDITERKLAEQALRESEEKYRLLVSSMSEGIHLCQMIWGEDGQPTDFIFLEVNPAYEQQTGLSRDRVLGRRIMEIIPDLEPVWLERYGEVVRSEQAIQFEEYNISTNRWYDVSAYSMPKTDLFCAVFKDISERRRLQNELAQAKEERFKRCIDNMHDCFAIFSAKRDDEGRIVDFTIEYVNDAACKDNNMTAQDHIGRGMREIFPNCEQPGRFEKYCHVVASGEPLETESITYSNEATPSIIWAYDLKVIKFEDGIAVSWRNITDKRKLEEALRENELRYRMLFENINDAIVLHEFDAEGNPVCFREVNDVTCHRLGYTREELLGLSMLDTHPPSTAIDPYTFIRKLQKEKSGTLETTHMAKDGTVIPVEINARYFISKGVHYVLAVARDLTERKRADRILKTSYTRIKRNNLLNGLVRAESLSEQQAREMLVEAGLTLSGPFTCYLGELQEWKGQSRDYWRQHLEELHYLQDAIVDVLSDDDCCLAWKSPYVVGGLHSGPVSGLDAKSYQTKLACQMQDKVERSIPELKVQIGISELSVKGAAVGDLYRQCCTALNVGKKIWPGNRIYHYLDMGVFQVFPQSANPEQIAAYIERTLGKLLRYETKKKPEYLLTLEALLESSNLSDTAKKLFVHQKTLDFRRKRIEQILGVSLGSFDTRMALAMALKLMKIADDNHSL